MARRKRHEGICHICGQYGPLSLEHVPPRAAFNDRRVVVVRFDRAIRLGPDEKIKGPVQQRGMGRHTLCERCNSITGHWYGGRFVDWCYQGMDILIRTQGRPSLFYMNYLFPLAVIKQIVSMFFSVNGERFQEVNQELVHFVLNRDAKYLSPRYRLFVYYNLEGRFRSVGVTGLGGSADGGFSVVSEISYPPFGYLMTLDSEPPDQRLFEVTHFTRYDYEEFAAVELRLPVLPTHLMYPGDYRTREEILQQAASASSTEGCG